MSKGLPLDKDTKTIVQNLELEIPKVGLGSQGGWDFNFPSGSNIKKIKRKIDAQIDVKFQDFDIKIKSLTLKS